MFITPQPDMLESKESENLGWHDALAEMIDNSFDAGATRVEIALQTIAGKRRLEVVDDGVGVADVAALVTFGSHKRHKTTSLGRYGVGLKDAWLYLGPRIEVRTVHASILTRFTLDRSDVRMIEGRWVVPDPVHEPTHEPSGTCIAFAPLRAGRKAPQCSCLDKLGWTFMPALESGRQIVFRKGTRKRPIASCVLPALNEHVQTTVDVCGKAVQLNVGVMPDGVTNTYPGIWICYGHRIVAASTIGCGRYSAARIAGTIRLGHGWRLTPHKNDIAELADELEVAIYAAIEPMLQRASELIEDIVSSRIRAEIEDALNTAIIDAKGQEKRRERQNETGRIQPTGRNGKRENAAVFDPLRDGSVKTKAGSNRPRRRTGVKVDWTRMDPGCVGRYDHLGNVIQLNQDNAFIAHAKHANNQDALRGIAIGILCYHCCNNEGNQRLLVEKRDFASSWGSVLSSLNFQKEKRRARNV